MTNPPGTDAAPDHPATVQPRPQGWIGLVPILVAVVGAIAAELYTFATIGMMIIPAVGFAIAGLTLIGTAVAIAALFRSITGQWRPFASTALALFAALVHWLPVLAPVPMLFSAVSTTPVLQGAAVGALAMLALPGRWRLAGAISAALIAVAVIAIFITG